MSCDYIYKYIYGVCVYVRSSWIEIRRRANVFVQQTYDGTTMAYHFVFRTNTHTNAERNNQ